MRLKPHLYCSVCKKPWRRNHFCPFTSTRYGWSEKAIGSIVYPVMSNGKTITENMLFVLSLLFLLVALVPWPTIESTKLAVGTDLFWQFHDDLFPSHYLQDGRVICTEAKAVKELNQAGIETEE